MIESIKLYDSVDEIVLGISEGDDNIIYKSICKKHKINYIIGSEEDVLDRLIKCCEKGSGTDIFRLTTESFYIFWLINDAWEFHKKNNFSITAIEDVPDGSGFEIIRLDSYKESWINGEDRHRSEYCSLYIRENKKKYKIYKYPIPKNIKRPDIRLTVDYPEDLVFCRFISDKFKEYSPLIPLDKIISYIDSNPEKKKLVDPFVEDGLKTMYL